MMATRSSDTADVMMPGPPFVTRNNNRGDMEVPELTSSVGINLNERIPLQRSATAISVSVPDFASHPDLAWRSRRAIIFRSAASFCS